MSSTAVWTQSRQADHLNHPMLYIEGIDIPNEPKQTNKQKHEVKHGHSLITGFNGKSLSSGVFRDITFIFGAELRRL